MAFSKKVLQLGVLSVLMSALICCGKQDSSTGPPQKIDPLLFKTATELTGAIRRGEITSRYLLNRYINSVERNNERVNAVVAMDVKAARARALEADKALAEGKDWGPLHGLPIDGQRAVKVLLEQPDLDGHGHRVGSAGYRRTGWTD